MLWFYITYSVFSHHIHILHSISPLLSLPCERPSSDKRGNQQPGETGGMWAKARKIICSFQLAVSFPAVSCKTCSGFYIVLWSTLCPGIAIGCFSFYLKLWERKGVRDFSCKRTLSRLTRNCFQQSLLLRSHTEQMLNTREAKQKETLLREHFPSAPWHPTVFSQFTVK